MTNWSDVGTGEESSWTEQFCIPKYQTERASVNKIMYDTTIHETEYTIPEATAPESHVIRCRNGKRMQGRRV